MISEISVTAPTKTKFIPNSSTDNQNEISRMFSRFSYEYVSKYMVCSYPESINE